MYNDNTNFSIKNLIVQFLFVALFIFILIWLFPLKSDLNKAVSDAAGSDTESVLLGRIFNENIIAMKDGAKAYYTTSRLPQNVGDKVKMTLGEMLEKKIVLDFTDKNGETCDLTASYVEITKYDDEYVMKVNLKCGEEENYLLVYMGCYDYCSTTICEKNETDVKNPVVYPVVNETKSTPTCTLEVVSGALYNGSYYVGNVVVGFKSKASGANSTWAGYGVGLSTTYANNTTYTLSNKGTTTVYGYVKNSFGNTAVCSTTVTIGEISNVTYLYEYSKTTAGYYNESDWSAESTTAVTATVDRAVKIRTATEQVLIGYNVTTTVDKSQPIYGTKEITIGTTTKEVCTAYDYVATGAYSYSNYSYSGDVFLNYYPTDTTTKSYVVYDDSTWICAEGCTAGTTHKYAVYTRTATAVTEYKCTATETQTVPLTTTIQIITGYKTTVTSTPVYQTRQVTYYSYKTRTWVAATTDTKWSTYNDTTLLNSGYSYTGNVKQK